MTSLPTGSATAASAASSANCTICLESVSRGVTIGRLACSHEFCFSCLLSWSKITNACPLCKARFTQIIHESAAQGVSLDRRTIEVVEIKDKEQQVADNIPFSIDPGACNACGSTTDEDVLLLCDGCETAYHIYCLNPRLYVVPEGDWFCPQCVEPEAKRQGAARPASVGAAAAAAASAGAGRTTPPPRAAALRRASAVLVRGDQPRIQAAGAGARIRIGGRASDRVIDLVSPQRQTPSCSAAASASCPDPFSDAAGNAEWHGLHGYSYDGFVVPDSEIEYESGKASKRQLPRLLHSDSESDIDADDLSNSSSMRAYLTRNALRHRSGHAGAAGAKRSPLRSSRSPPSAAAAALSRSSAAAAAVGPHPHSAGAGAAVVAPAPRLRRLQRMARSDSGGSHGSQSSLTRTTSGSSQTAASAAELVRRSPRLSQATLTPSHGASRRSPLTVPLTAPGAGAAALPSHPDEAMPQARTRAQQGTKRSRSPPSQEELLSSPPPSAKRMRLAPPVPQLVVPNTPPRSVVHRAADKVVPETPQHPPGAGAAAGDEIEWSPMRPVVAKKEKVSLRLKLEQEHGMHF